ncbi:hypothetical protein PQO01_16745 [Lentisphaera marina]|uniref:glycoside hydrolase domain-containing protein n=1 Tax=Lentisphaera marina TaxID=1111041 RepID=UPI002366A8BA|nr:glycoside hydrolase domain-containing protein [Lentisphaera marina]MDD7986601.1 hypothetical protein [Lentisphaera marina]
MKYLYYIFLLFSFLTFADKQALDAVSYSFDNGLEPWRSYGDGVIIHEKNLGGVSPGSVKMSCTKNKQATTYIKQSLSEGKYLVELSLRAYGVESGQWGQSIMIFYDNGSGTEFVTKDLKGTFEWSKISFTVEVKDKPLVLWVRLKSLGVIWFDDVKFSPAENDKAYTFVKSKKDFFKVLKPGKGKRCEGCYRYLPRESAYCGICGMSFPKQEAKRVRTDEAELLLDFEASEEGKKAHYIREFNSEFYTEGKSSGVIKAGKYNNLNLGEINLKDWSAYDYIALDIYNPTDIMLDFYLTINDGSHRGYWDQLNHLTRLSPGWNKLKFKIRTYVGERGSVTYKRYLNLANIKKVWFATGIKVPNNGEELYVDNVRLLPGVALDKFEGLRAFDFVLEKFRTQEGFTGIQSQHTYHDDVGFGFEKARITRELDSKYASLLDRDGLFLTDGAFRVNVPNGEYQVILNVNSLGMWYEHFWKKRQVRINGELVLDENYDDYQGYLKRFLRFADIEPSQDDNPYDLYLKEIFSPIEKRVQVKDGKILIEIKGDDYSICLNSLIIYPEAKKTQGKAFLAKLYELQKNEFLSDNRLIQAGKVKGQENLEAKHIKSGVYFEVIDYPSERIEINEIPAMLSDTLDLKSALNGNPGKMLALRLLDKSEHIDLSVSGLKSEEGHTISSSAIHLRYGINQYQSQSFNHESYVLAPLFFRDFPENGRTLEKDLTRVLYYSVDMTDVKPGLYTGHVLMKRQNGQQKIKVKLQVFPFELPEMNLASGYFGLNPVPAHNLQVEGISKYKDENIRKALKILKKRGFTSFTELPPVRFSSKDGILNLNSYEFEDSLVAAQEYGFKKIFSYGGAFMGSLNLDTQGNIHGMPKDEYHKQAGELLAGVIKKYPSIEIVLNISDEAHGYSQKVERDVKRLNLVQEFYPYLKTGGYTHEIKKGAYGTEINFSTFDELSYSTANKESIQHAESTGKKWGMYNQGIALEEYNREVFGQAMFTLHKKGAAHMIQWYFNGHQNYPYYDLDGRENDAMMVYPRMDGGLDYGIKFELATQGVEDYRLLQLLDSLAKGAKGAKAREWLNKHYYDYDPAPVKYSTKQMNFTYKNDELRELLYKMILELVNQ